LAVGALPAGDYALHVTASRPRGGELAVTIGGGREPIDAIRLRPAEDGTSADDRYLGVWVRVECPCGDARSVRLQPGFSRT
jgi:hypothetical protein